jgi:hypothetical protein
MRGYHPGKEGNGSYHYDPGLYFGKHLLHLFHYLQLGKGETAQGTIADRTYTAIETTGGQY